MTHSNSCLTQALALLAFCCGSIVALIGSATLVEALWPYPPPGWAQVELSGVVVSRRQGEKVWLAPKHSRDQWALVRTSEGKEVEVPMDVHNQIPGVGERVLKERDQEDLQILTGPAPRQRYSIRPSRNPGDELGLVLLLWALLSSALGGALFMMLRPRRPKSEAPPGRSQPPEDQACSPT